MDSYILTRQQAAEKLEISTRSVDRYVKSWKIRSKKKWNKVFLNIDDVENLIWWENNTQVIITNKKDLEEQKNTIETENNDESNIKNQFTTSWIVKKSDYDKLTKTFESVYKDLREQIDKKDELIWKMSIELWKYQEKVKHSISLSEHNRSQILLEESKNHIAKQMTSLDEKRKELEEELKKEKFDKKVLIILVFIFLFLSAYFWFKMV